MSIHISEIIHPGLLHQMITQGYIRKVKHPEYDLWILGYTEKAQFEKKWNDATLNCRGLIVDDFGNIYGRPWKKFFNLGEGNAEIDMFMPVEVTDKMDGSLGIMFVYDDKVRISTRGSFASDQAKHANKILAEKYDGLDTDAASYFTFLFEIVYPANRIVCNYGEMDDLVLLGAVNIDFGYYLGPGEAASILCWSGPVTETFEYKTMQDAFSADPRSGKEGFVIRSGSKMVKIKQIDYVELHRIVTNLNERTVWKMLGDGKTVAEICEPLPDEFHKFVIDTAASLHLKQSQMVDVIVDIYVSVVSSLPDGFSRAEFARAVSKSDCKKYLFVLLDKKPIDALVWSTLKPAVSKE